MQIKDIMLKDVITVRRSTTLRHLLKIFYRFHIFPLVPVINEENKLEGIVSFRNLIDVFKPLRPDILKTIPFLDEEREDIFAVELTKEAGDLMITEDIMEYKYISVKEESTLENAYNLMKLHKKDQLPVVDENGRLSGMVGIFDIVREVFHARGIV